MSFRNGGGGNSGFGGYSPAIRLAPTGAGITDGAGIFLAVEFYLADAGASPLELLGGDDDLADVLIGLSEMGAELVDAVAQAAEIVHQVSDLGVNLVGGLAHLAVAMDLLDYLDRQHQQRSGTR